MRLANLSGQALTEAFATVGTSHDDWFIDLLGQGRCRRLFDYSYDTNAMALFDPQLPAGTPRGAVSKVSLQLLYHMRASGPMSEAAIIGAMHAWKGTGRYPVSSMGQASSRTTIIARLVGIGLLAEDPKGRIGLSDAGARFLDRLHPGCGDPDQIVRLDGWCRDWRSSRPAVERHLRTFFGQQKRLSTNCRGSALVS